MATLNLGGRKITVDDSFMSLSPQDQQNTVNEIEKSLGGSQPISRETQAAQPKSISGFASNFVPDAIDQATSLGSMAVNVFNPNRDNNTLAQMVDVLTGGVANGLNTVLPNSMQFKPQNAAEQAMLDKANAVGQSLKDNYGSMDAIGNTLYNHPVGAAIDVASLATGGEGLLRKAGMETAANVAGKVATFTNPVNAITKPMGAVLSKVMPDVKATILDSQALGKIKNDAYGDVKRSGIVYNQQAVDGLVSSIGRGLDKEGLNIDRHPKTFSFIDEIERLKGRALSLKELDEFRQMVGKEVTTTPDPSDARFGNIITNKIDKFTDNTSPNMVVSGSNANAAELLNSARDANKTYRNTQMFEDALNKGERAAASTGKGANTDNAIRQKVNALINENKGRNFKRLPQDVRDKMLEVVNGTPTRNAARYLGQFAPTGIVSTIGGGSIGSYLGGLLGPSGAVIGGAIPIAGYAAKKIGDIGTKRALDDVVRAVQNSSNLRMPSSAPKNLNSLSPAALKALTAGQMIQFLSGRP